MGKKINKTIFFLLVITIFSLLIISIQAGMHDSFIKSDLNSEASIQERHNFKINIGYLTIDVAHNIDNDSFYDSIQSAIDDADPGDIIKVIVPNHSEGPQIHVDKDIIIFGNGCGSTVISPTDDTGTDGDSRGWWLIDSGIEFNLHDLTLDGAGYNIYQAIRHKGYGTIDDVCFNEIKYLSVYSGVAVAAFGSSGPVDITNCRFENIGRIGVLYYGVGISGSIFDDNTYIGKGDGDWLDYCLDISAGASITVNGNYISDCTGIASSDGSESAGIMATTYYGPGTTATITCNEIFDCTYGIIIGYDEADASTVIANYNNLIGNDYGIYSTAPQVEGTCNWWGDHSGPAHDSNPAGNGDAVNDYIIYDPWIQVDADAGGPYDILYGSKCINFNTSDIEAEVCGEINYQWDFGDGYSSTEIDPTHCYRISGTYTVKLTVTLETPCGFTYTDYDITKVAIYDGDGPVVWLKYPEGGEILQGIVKVKWFAIDDSIRGEFLPVYLYYSADDGDTWRQINDVLHNNIDQAHGEYDWDTSVFSDGSYLLKLEAVGGRGIDVITADTSKPFIIDNGYNGVKVSDVRVTDITIDSYTYVKDGDDLKITGGITGGIGIDREEITADLSGFGMGEEEIPDTYDGFTATWNLNNVICINSNGPTTVSVTASEIDSNNAIITADNTKPEISIYKPKNGIYFFNSRLFPFTDKTIIIGGITIEPETYDNYGIKNIEFYLNGELYHIDSSEYPDWYMNMKQIGRRNLQIIAYDYAGNKATESINIIIFKLLGK